MAFCHLSPRSALKLSRLMLFLSNLGTHPITTVGPVRQPFRHIRRLLDQPHLANELTWSHRAPGRAKQTAHHHGTDYPPLAHEAMLHKAPLVVPAEDPAVNFEGFEQPQLAAEFAPGISHDRHCPMTQGGTIGATAQHEVHAPHISHIEIPTIGDMPVEIEIRRPDTHANDGGGQAVNGLAPRATEQQEQKPEPQIHEYTDGRKERRTLRGARWVTVGA